MSETKEEISAERDALRAENEQLRTQLATAGAGRAYAPAQRFMLSEGNRAELETYGVTNIGGVRMTRDDVAARLGPDQAGVDLGDRDPVDGAVPPAGPRSAIRGVDFVYPSVAPGQIDPAVAGTPGINGPAAK